jgi:phosphoglycerol transferase MdoB-like AlkP superfamily enzyme
MKITGYTIIYFLLSILLSFGLYHFEILIWNKSLKEKSLFPFIMANFIILLIIFAVLEVKGYLNKLDKLLKKRIL